MYYEYFGLSQPPFRITPDTSLFYPGGNRGAVLQALIYAITSGEGIVKVVGEVGSGKTMLCRMLEQDLPDSVEIVYLANPRLPPENLLHAIAFELKLPVHSGTPRLQVMTRLQEYLVQRHAENRQVVVFVEEAQSMPIATLEEIRLLSNLETRSSKLLQIVLFGQPELDLRIGRQEIRQLKERITYSFQLTPFRTPDVREYLNSRMRACGYRSGDVFSDGAVRLIRWYSLGLIRRINILADKSLLAAFAENTHQVSARHVQRAARDSEFTPLLKQLWRPAAVASTAVIAGVVAIWWLSAAAPALTDGAQAEPAFSKYEPGPAPAEAAMAAGQVPIAHPQAERLESSVPEREPAAPVSKEDPSAAEPVAGIPETAELAAQPEESPSPPTDLETAGDREEPALLPQPRLLGIDTLLQLQSTGDARLSPRESTWLREQIAAFPPESLYPDPPSSADDVCRVCWSIVYRPLLDPEGL
jgi:MSHA biogenesis protein MshM